MKSVNADDVLKILHKYGKYIFVTDEKKYSSMVDEIANLKASKQEPKIGHWIDNMDLGYHVSICSNCNWRGHGDTYLIYKSKYCPNCGAKMIEPQESEDKE